MDAFLVIDKPRGVSSQQAVSRVRRALGAAKAGHTGTLDPLATGVLPVALGEATKVIAYLDEALKVYRVAGVLGVTTDSYDADGRETGRAPYESVTREGLLEALAGFRGELAQVPPAYSAIKREGKPLYDYARRGEAVVAEARAVSIQRLELEAFTPPRFELRVECSKGTYVRSLVHDLGTSLGCGAHVVELRRLRSGPFAERDALDLAALTETPGAAPAKLLSIEACLSHLPLLALESEQERERVGHGVPLHRIQQLIENKSLFDVDCALAFGGKIVAVIAAARSGAFRYGRVLNR